MSESSGETASKQSPTTSFPSKQSPTTSFPSILPGWTRDASSWMSGPSTYTIPAWVKLSGVALVVLSVLLMITYCRAIGDTDASLYGFWEVDGDFADKAHLDAMYMYISPPNGDSTQSIGHFGKDLSIYMFLKADSEVKFNRAVKSHISRRTVRLDVIQKYAIDFGVPVSIIPRKITAEYDMVTQMLVLKDSKQTYARMFKKPEVSFYCTSEASRSSNANTKKSKSVDVDDDAGDAQGDEAEDNDADDTAEPADITGANVTSADTISAEGNDAIADAENDE